MIAALAGALVVAVAGGSAAASSGGWQSPATRCEIMTGKFRLPDSLRGIVADMCQRSSTFRRQVARLADADGLTITVRLGALQTTTAWRAQTTMAKVGGVVTSADVQVPAGHARLVAELIAHEFEHVLEQLDGVVLKRWVGQSGVHRVGAHDTGPIETERANQVGRLVAGEYVAATAELTALKAR